MGGMPDVVTFPKDEFLALTERVVREQLPSVLNYGSGPGDIYLGDSGLRQALAELALHEEGRPLSPENFLITPGGATAMSLAFSAYLDPGEVCIIESPTWDYTQRDINTVHARAASVLMDQDGMQMDTLEQTLKELKQKGQRVKLLYTIPNFHVPRGVCMSLSRRKRLIALAKEWQFMVFEDDTYGDLRYEGQPIPSLFGLDDSGLVMKLKSFSKILAPSLRIGYLMADVKVIDTVHRMRRDLGTSVLVSRILAEWVKGGYRAEHLKRIAPFYRNKRDIMRAALEKYCAPYATWNKPDGGYFLWLTFTDKVDPEKFPEEATQRGLSYRPGNLFYPQRSDDGRRNIRATFSGPPAELIDRGMAALGEAFAASAR